MPDDQQSRSEEPASTGESFLQRLKALFGQRQTSSSLRESLEGALDEAAGVATDPFSAKERSMLRNVLGLRDLRVDDVMVPRADIDAVEVNITIADLIKEFREAGHSRLPIYRETLDEPLGMVHIKDLLGWMTEHALLSEEDLERRRAKPPGGLDMRRIPLKTSLTDARLIRNVLYVPPSMPAVDLLVKMQATRVHMAIVVDEYGGTDGLVSIEDLVEEIVGEIEDEHDEESAPMIVPTDDGGFIADARAPIEEVSAMLGAELEIGDSAEDIDTLGGLVFDRAGHVPVRGELVSFPGGYEFEILDADPRRIKRVRIHRRSQDAPRPVRRERADKDRSESGRPESDRTEQEQGDSGRSGPDRSDAA
jgi:CBS domain containing-hemolysin-like protein